MYVWLAVDRNRNKVIDIEVTTTRDFQAYYVMALRLESKYKIKILCTDAYDVYGKYLISERHVVTKAETSLVESKNSLIRHYLARFHRRTKRYSKAMDMIINSLFMLFNVSLM